MNYLDLVRRLKREAQFAGAAPLTTVGAAGDTLLLCDWINDAWRDIQLMPRNWKWLRTQALGTVTAAGGTTYTADQLIGGTGNRFASWKPDGPDYWVTVFDPLVPANESRVREIDYEDFRRRFLIATHTAGTPQFRATSPTRQMLVGPTPDKTYTLRADYQKSVQVLALDADPPEMPADYHMAIVWRALLSYAGFDAAPDVLARAAGQYSDLEAALVREHGESLSYSYRQLA